MDYFAHNVAIVLFLILQTLLFLSIAQFIEDPRDDPKCKNESIYSFRHFGSFYSGDSDAVFQDDLCSVNNYESLLLRTDDDFLTYKRISRKYWYNAGPRRGPALSIQIVNFLIEFVGALYCFCILQNFSKNTLDNFNANLFWNVNKLALLHL